MTHLGLICVIIKDHQDQCWHIDTTEDVEMGEVRLGNADQLHQGVLHWTIQGLPIPEQLQYKQGKVGLSEGDDAVVKEFRMLKQLTQT